MTHVLLLRRIETIIYTIHFICDKDVQQFVYLRDI